MSSFGALGTSVATASRPVIGITMDHENAGGYSKFPWYALRENYCGAVVAAGGMPLPLPHHVELVPDFLDKIDGLVITGGAFDVDPALFGEVTRHEKTALKENRTAFEWAITKGMLAANKPVLGICGGEQLLAVILGGTLIQHIPDSIVDALPHEQPNPRDEAGHDVDVVPHTLLHRLVGQRRIAVNSAHHQAVRDVPDGVCVNARADDGVIEGIESPAYKFCLGVQWHPEFHISPADEAILQAFVDASR